MGKKRGPSSLVGATPKHTGEIQRSKDSKERPDVLSDGLSDPLGDRLADPLGDVQMQGAKGAEADHESLTTPGDPACFGCVAGGDTSDVVQTKDSGLAKRARPGATVDAAIQAKAAGGQLAPEPAEGDAVQAREAIATPAAKPGKPGGEAHPDAKGEKPFTDKEQTWIDQVLKNPLVNLLFSSYSDIPTATLHRVASIAGAKGQFSAKGNDVAIADKVYKNKDEHTSSDGTKFKETNQEAFKGTLIHELFHFAEHNAKLEKAGLLLPSDVVGVLSDPKSAGFPEYAFGWFVHPKTEYILHFQLPSVVGLSADVTIIDQPELMAIREAGKWERSPMPESGNSISAEEDMCESISMCLTSKRTHDAFKSAYPMRYRLIDRYFGSLLALAKKGK
jgi:hypothetical protein